MLPEPRTSTWPVVETSLSSFTVMAADRREMGEKKREEAGGQERHFLRQRRARDCCLDSSLSRLFSSASIFPFLSLLFHVLNGGEEAEGSLSYCRAFLLLLLLASATSFVRVFSGSCRLFFSSRLVPLCLPLCGPLYSTVARWRGS